MLLTGLPAVKPRGYDEKMKPILILKTGSTFSELMYEAGDFEDWIIAASGETPGVFTVADGIDETLPALEQLSGIIVTGSHRMVSEGGRRVELWSQLMRDAVVVRLPVLGICYGHQLLAQALGGRVANHPQGIELGQVTIEMAAAARDDALFSVLPARFSAYASHLQSIIELPPGAFVYGANNYEPYHAVRFAPAAWGVQFHPEFNQQIMRAYIQRHRPLLADDQTMEALADKVTPLPDAGALLQEFCRLTCRFQKRIVDC